MMTQFSFQMLVQIIVVSTITRLCNHKAAYCSETAMPRRDKRKRVQLSDKAPPWVAQGTLRNALEAGFGSVPTLSLFEGPCNLYPSTLGALASGLPSETSAKALTSVCAELLMQILAIM